MEVHHSHNATHNKRWTGYLLEFFMLFLAVFLGFIAENIREHIVEKERERQYIKSFIEDLSNDERSLPMLISAIERQQIYPADSLPLLFSKVDTKQQANSIYVYLRSITRQQGINIFVTDRTIAQLRNSGSMRLIQNKQVSDSIVDYYKEIGYVAYLQELLIHQKELLRESFSLLLKSSDYDKVIDSHDKIINPSENLYLRSVDPNIINNCLLYVSDVRGLSITIRTLIINIKSKAGNIKKLLLDKYGLKKG